MPTSNDDGKLNILWHPTELNPQIQTSGISIVFTVDIDVWEVYIYTHTHYTKANFD